MQRGAPPAGSVDLRSASFRPKASPGEAAKCDGESSSDRPPVDHSLRWETMATALDRMTDFDLTQEQRLMRQTVSQFAEAKILPHVEQYEREERYPLELIAKPPDAPLAYCLRGVWPSLYAKPGQGHLTDSIRAKLKGSPDDARTSSYIKF